MITFIWYPNCSTCKRAKKWLDEHGIVYKERHIVEECPTLEELSYWYQHNPFPLKKYFNASGNLYKAWHLKEKLVDLSERQQLELLSTNGMLIRRPIVVKDEKILIGLKEQEWEAFFQV